MRSILIAGAGLMLAFAVPVSAQADTLGQLKSCAKILPDADRLSCYDAAVAAMERPLKTPDVTALDQSAPTQDTVNPSADAEVQQTNEPAPAVALDKAAVEGTFGAEDLPARLPDGSQKKQPKQFITGVAEFGRTNQGKYLVILENGQIWKQLTADGTTLQVPGDLTQVQVKIRRGFMGSHFLSVVPNKTSIRVQRIK